MAKAKKGAKTPKVTKVPYGAPGKSKNPFSGAMAQATTKKKGGKY